MKSACWITTIVVIAGSYTAGCGGPGGTEGAGDVGLPEVELGLQDDDAGAPDPGGDRERLEFERLVVAQGTSMTIDANTEIVSHTGIDIVGNVLIEPGSGGNFVLSAVEGDVEISGRILVQDDGRTATSVGARRPLQNTPLEPGVSIELVAERGDLVLKKTTLLQSGRGRDAPPETFSGPGGLHVGRNGSDGGSIILRAPLGVVRFPSDRGTGDPALFGLGSGGRGADVTVAAGFTTSESRIEVRAGHGGRCGSLIIEGTAVEGSPDVMDLVDSRGAEPPLIEVAIDRAAGGNGGSVRWIIPYGSEPDFAEALLFAGDGGDGIVTGGRGGDALYESDRPINPYGVPAAVVSCYGGSGGDVFASPVPVMGATGGPGGGAGVLGNNGRNGGLAPDGTEHLDGARGGDVLGQGGDGGDVLPGVLAVNSRGGPGGGILPVGVLAGYGGMGMSRCDGCRGGHGGDGGHATAFGGKGGDALNAPYFTQLGGRGGDASAALGVEQAVGGDGNPPGRGGCPGQLSVEPGAGGQAEIPGDPGEDLTTEEPLLDCAASGAACGSDEECDEPDQGTGNGPPIDACDQPGATFTAKSVGLVVGDNYSNRLTVVVEGEVFPNGGWAVVGGSVNRLITQNGEVIEQNLDESLDLYATSTVSKASTPDCHDGTIQWDSIVVRPSDSTVHTYTLSGCNPFGYQMEDRDEYFCCPGSRPDSWRVCRE